MVQISLPKNSEVKKGKYFQDKTGSINLRKVKFFKEKFYRFNDDN